jgi:hypothetical protein
MKNVDSSMALDEVRGAAARLQRDIASGPVAPALTPQEIIGLKLSLLWRSMANQGTSG